jgi:CO/xanthine dehydrogenase Mo-binding subunit
VRLVLHSGGRLSIYASHHEYGQGARAALAAFASRSLGIDPAVMDISAVDTGATPPTGPTTASRQTFLTGNALLLTAAALKKRVFALAGEAMKIEAPAAGAGRFRIDGDSILDTETGKSVKLAELGEKFEAEERYTSPRSAPLLEKGKMSAAGTRSYSSRPTHWCYTYGTHIAVVAVNEKTGEIRVMKVIAVHDVGTVINRGAVIGQIEGGVMTGLGYALSENMIVEDGICVSNTLGKVGLPYADLMPEIESVLLEIPHPQGPLGLKGFAEGPSIPTTPAILNAVYRAAGKRITELPINLKPQR